MIDVKKLPYAEWLEDTIRLLAGSNVKSIALAAETDDQVLTSYFDAEAAEKALLATHIQADALFDMTLANARMIVEAAEEQEDGDAAADD